MLVRMHVVIAGCGRVGSSLAHVLIEDGHDVTVVDRNPRALESLGKSFDGAVVEGTAYDVDVLRMAGLQAEDVLVASTGSDNANLMAVEIARRVFNVERAIARLYDPSRERAYRALGIQYVTATKLITNILREQIIDEEFVYHVAFDDGDVEVVEFVLNKEADGLRVDDIEVRNKLRVAAVRRGPDTFVPSRRFVLQAGDLVVASAREGVKRRIDRFIEQD